MGRQQQPDFLPVSPEELHVRGVEKPDIIIVSGDAYVDHPSFATAILGRVLWDAGFHVAVIPQPDHTRHESFTLLGGPRLFFAISGGSVDSMVSSRTPALKRRSKDAYSPGGRLKRPDRAVLVYSEIVHRLFPDIPVVIGGIEASLRRFAHYDFWTDKIRQSILADAPADLLVYGMGEKTLCTIASRADSGEKIQAMGDIPGTAWKLPPREYRETDLPDICEIPSFSRVKENMADFAAAHACIRINQDPFRGKTLVQQHPKTVIIQNPPALPLSTEEMDRIYELPFRREAHPSYHEPVPALEPVRFSVVSHRGCYGNCNFCALSMHQGSIIQSRSRESLFREIDSFRKMKGFKGIISDLGGPSANMYGDSCPNWKTKGVCTEKECLSCRSRQSGLRDYLDILDTAETLPGIRHVFIGSGIRYDLIPLDRRIMERIASHISGHMKVAPEHICTQVTRYMNKPDGERFDAFRRLFADSQKDKPRKQYLVPYLMSGHPGCTIGDMIMLAEYLRDHALYTEQVQDFTPTPLTTSTCMYVTGIDPQTGDRVHVPRGDEKQIQRALLHWKDPANHDLVRQGLTIAGREDLIGNRRECLVPRARRGEIERVSRKDRSPRRDP